jgi:hypothetical protein
MLVGVGSSEYMYMPAVKQISTAHVMLCATASPTSFSFSVLLQVASVFNMPVQQLLQDNIRTIRTPDQFLGGLTLTLCGVLLVKHKPKPKPPIVYSQVEALLGIRDMIDRNGVLASSWNLRNINRYAGMCLAA